MKVIGRTTLFVAVIVMAPTAILAQQKVNTIHRPQFVAAAAQPSANVIPQLRKPTVSGLILYPGKIISLKKLDFSSNRCTVSRSHF